MYTLDTKEVANKMFETKLEKQEKANYEVACQQLEEKFANLFLQYQQYGDVLSNKPKKNEDEDMYYKKMGYKLVTLQQRYFGYGTRTVTVTTGSYTVSSNGSDYTVSPETRDEEEVYEIEKSTQASYWVKIVPHGTRKEYENKINSFLAKAPVFFSIDPYELMSYEKKAPKKWLFVVENILLSLYFLLAAFSMEILLKTFPIYEKYNLSIDRFVAFIASIVVLFLLFIWRETITAPYRDNLPGHSLNSKMFNLSSWFVLVTFFLSLIAILITRFVRSETLDLFLVEIWSVQSIITKLRGLIFCFIAVLFLVSLFYGITVYPNVQQIYKSRSSLISSGQYENLKKQLAEISSVNLLR